ncbi:MAG TPA: carboxypeptidase regulatory-like domain-containing protein [Bryobacteraceae bacterium]|nr:carboxypeptidase regulatory-like domain-containing protein [Bryobacteraceae bacterium]
MFFRRHWFLFALIATAATAAGEKPPKTKPAQATVAGTVFREPGFALAGANIVLQPDPGRNTSHKVKKMNAVSDVRGEFGFRVPATPMSYTLTIQAAGYLEESRSVSLAGEERQDVFVTLKPDPAERKKGPK